jgi:cell division transport system permease protein
VIPRIASALRRAGRIAVERPRAALWTTLALTCALFAVAVAALAATNVDRWAGERPGSTASMVVYLGEGVTDARAQELVGELRGLRGVERAELVPPAESARRLVGSLGSDAALLEGIDVATLPASVEVTLAPGVRDVVAMSPTVRALRGAPGVADVVVEDKGDDRISGALATVRAIAWGAAALFAGLALVTVLAAIRVRLDRGRNELAVLELLGAGPGFLAVPTALAGALQGIVAALLAAGVLAIGLHVYGDSLADSLTGSLGPVELAIPGAAMLGMFVAAGALLGLVGGGLAGASRVAR